MTDERLAHPAEIHLRQKLLRRLGSAGRSDNGHTKVGVYVEEIHYHLLPILEVF